MGMWWFYKTITIVDNRLAMEKKCIFVIITLLAGIVFSVLAYYINIGTYLLLFIPLAIALISLIGNVVLTTWFCTLWRRKIARRDVLKEIGIFFALFFFTL